MASVSKNVYIDKLDDMFNRYNNTYHSIIKIKPVDVKSKTYTKLMIKILNLKLVILLEYQNMFQIGLKKFLLLQKLKILFRGHILLGILKEKKLVELFTKKKNEKQIKKSLELKK